MSLVEVVVLAAVVEAAVATSVEVRLVAVAEGLTDELPLEARARAWKALKLLGLSATALTAKTIPIGQWPFC